MKIIKTLTSTSILGLLLASPVLAKEDVVVTEKRCEIRVEDGKVTKTGDCDEGEIHIAHMGEGMSGDSRVMIMRMNGEGPGADGFPGMSRLLGGSGHHPMPGGMHFSGERRNMDWDTDGNGEVSDAEVKTAKAAELKQYDRNHNGSLSLKEYQDMWLTNNRNQMVDAFQALDEDGDSKVTGEEFTAPAAHHFPMQMRVHFETDEEETDDSDD